MKKTCRISVNLTPKQKQILNAFSNDNDISVNESIRRFIDIASGNYVREILICTNNKTKLIRLKDENVTFFKRFRDNGEVGDWVDTFAMGMTVEEVVNNLIECKNCTYKDYIVAFDDGEEIKVDDINQFMIETLDGGKLWY